ncbi:hypothetical protein SEA_ENYGMA_217 [Streptomyces phage Enygma]
MNKLTNIAVSSVVVGGLAFGLVGCKDSAPSDFQKRCDKAHGKVMREDDFEDLSMAPMAFVAGRSKPSSGGSKKSGGSSLSKLFGGGNKNKDKKSKKNKKGHSNKHKSHDNEWVCVKDGQELFDED